MTQAGLDKLKKELADALAQRPVISAAIAEAREKGDLSENAEYDAARDAQGLLEVKIARLKEKVANARVIDESKLSADSVQLLSKVKVKNLAKGEGLNCATGEYGDLIAMGVSDPVKVTRTALESAASVAALILITEATINEIPKDPDPAAAAAAAAAGMGGMM